MKVACLDFSTGEVDLVTAPHPKCPKNMILVQSNYSLISPGTEKMLRDFGKSSLVQKALKQPDKLKDVIAKISTDGLVPTLEAVNHKLGELLPLGYCNVGRVIEVGEAVVDFKVGDRVVSNGPHSDIVCVSPMLCCHVPDDVLSEDASFVVLASIALHACRLASPTLGERFAVIGVGLLGLLSVQILKAHGCNVLAFDTNPERLQEAEILGADTFLITRNSDPIAFSKMWSRNVGVDAVIVATSGNSAEPVRNAVRMSRKKGRVVILGTSSPNVSRTDLYYNEVSLQVSCSYGPGRYDPLYENESIDYPVGYVRWTQKRNFQAILDLLSNGSLSFHKLISKKVEFNDVKNVYRNELDENLTILIDYKSEIPNFKKSLNANTVVEIESLPSQPNISFIGAGNYAVRQLLPAFKKCDVNFATIVTQGGTKGSEAARKFGFQSVSTSIDAIFDDHTIASDCVVIATRHDSHADLTARSLMSKKHVFVEKPLALTSEQLLLVKKAFYKSQKSGACPQLAVGFNRRFSPHTKKVKEILNNFSGPKFFVVTVNAGTLPEDHWLLDKSVGGGRLIGEACHFIDLIRHLCGSNISDIHAIEHRVNNASDNNISIFLNFSDGSDGVIHYCANGHNSYPKERVEVFFNNSVLTIENFKLTKGYGIRGFKSMRTLIQDKGQKEMPKKFIHSLKSGVPIIPIDEIWEVSEATILAEQSIA